MKSDSITVQLRLSAKSDSKVKAFADVTIPLGDDGTITTFGFTVLDGAGRPARVSAHAFKTIPPRFYSACAASAN
jgi:hypothetical protein